MDGNSFMGYNCRRKRHVLSDIDGSWKCRQCRGQSKVTSLPEDVLPVLIATWCSGFLRCALSWKARWGRLSGDVAKLP